MKRREFIAGLGSAAAWPLAARAQQGARMRRIGVLLNYAEDDPNVPARLAVIEQGLQELSWTVGRNIQIDYRFGAGDPDLLRKYAAELVALAPDIILAQGSVALRPLLQMTRVSRSAAIFAVEAVNAFRVEASTTKHWSLSFAKPVRYI